jgi:hypothetical protein
MENQTAVAASSAADDVFGGQEPTFDEYNSYRQTGELPARFKPAESAESAPAGAPEETEESEGEEPETEPESDPEEAQEPPQKGSGAEKRIKQLLARVKELERIQAAKPDGKSGSSPAQPPRQPQTYQEYRQAFKPSAFIEDYAKAHPEASYEDANAAMADHLLDVRDHFRSIEQRVQAEKQALDAKLSDARERYEDFDEIKSDFLSKAISPEGVPLLPLQVLGIINDSEVLPDLLYTIGSDDAELAKFVEMAKTNPNKAIRYVARVESLIAEELAKPEKNAARGEDGKFKAPERKTSAPKPPALVSGSSSRAFDVSDESLSAEEWASKRNAELQKRGKA